MFLLGSTHQQNESEDEKEMHDMFVRSCGIVNELFTDILKFILSCNVAPSKSADVARKIRNLTSAQRATAMDVEKQGNYNACNFDLLYLFIVHGLISDQPARGWGHIPSDNDTGVGDDIERMRILTDFIIGQSNVKRFETGKYTEILEEARNMCTRIDNINPAVSSSFYADCLRKISDQVLDDQIRERYLRAIKQIACNQADLKTERKHFVKMGRIVLGLNPCILQAILDEQLPRNICAQKAHKLGNLTAEQQTIINLIRTEGYKKCDTTLMYKLLRNLCSSIPKPKSGWGKDVLDADLSIGDDIERIRQRRNNFGHSNDAYMSSTAYTTLMKESRAICQRMDASAPSSHSPYLNQARLKFLPMLEDIDNESIDTSLRALHDMQRTNEMSTSEKDMLDKLDILLNQQKDVKAAGKTLHKFTYT